MTMRRCVCRAAGLAGILWACAGPVREPGYGSLDEAMAGEVEPLVEGLLPAELNKDAAAVDFAAIAPRARSVAALFRSATQTGSPLYLEHEPGRTAAERAATWFTQIADAAGGRQHERLVALYAQKREICTQCHD